MTAYIITIFVSISLIAWVLYKATRPPFDVYELEKATKGHYNIDTSFNYKDIQVQVYHPTLFNGECDLTMNVKDLIDGLHQNNYPTGEIILEKQENGTYIISEFLPHTNGEDYGYGLRIKGN